jgi:hypothetical protein
MNDCFQQRADVKTFCIVKIRGKLSKCLVEKGIKLMQNYNSVHYF